MKRRERPPASASISTNHGLTIDFRMKRVYFCPPDVAVMEPWKVFIAILRFFGGVKPAALHQSCRI